MKTYDPCLDALMASASGLDRAVQKNEWKRLSEMASSPEGKSVALGAFKPERIESDYVTVNSYIGIEKAFDAKTSFTNDMLDRSIKLPD
jgi:NitT/TauT family transport system substrate-binding protein